MNKTDILSHLTNVVFPAANEALKRHYTKHFSNLDIPTLNVDGDGRKYVRVSLFKFEAARGKSYPTSVLFFVDTTNGNVLYPAGYKAPVTTNLRGNIFDKDILGKMSAYGLCHANGSMCGEPLLSYLS